jgi:hypothetical protein
VYKEVKEVLAGNTVHLTRTCLRPTGSSVDISNTTARIVVEAPSGTVTELVGVNVAVPDVETIVITADWTPPDTAAGDYTITTKTANGLNISHQWSMYVIPRETPVLP